MTREEVCIGLVVGALLMIAGLSFQYRWESELVVAVAVVTVGAIALERWRVRG